MPAQAISMRTFREVLRLHTESQLSQRQIARALKLSQSTVSLYLRRARESGLTWPLPETVRDDELKRLCAPKPTVPRPGRPLPVWNTIHQELQRKGVTLRLLWEEYIAAHPDGYQYSRFCDFYRAWRGKLDVVMRQDHRAGEKLFVDYAGMTVPITSLETGLVRDAQIFVAVLGCSNYTYAEATWTQQLEDWIMSHARAFQFFGAVPEIVVCDNLRSGVKKAHRYDPEINRTYQDLAQHYGVAIVPARVRKPKDKAKAEQGVKHVESRVLARLRNQQFFGLDALNEQFVRGAQRQTFSEAGWLSSILV